MSPLYKFKNRGIEIKDYEFYPASIYPHGTIQRSDMVEIDLGQSPPVIRTKKEIFFISSEKHDQLQKFAKKNKVNLVETEDIWSLILNPALDYERDFGDRTEVLNKLENLGVGTYEVDKLRDRLTSFMINYNFSTRLWEYVQLTHWDILTAHLIWLEGDSIKLVPKDFITFRASRNEEHWESKWKGKNLPLPNVGKEEFKQFYWESMEIATRQYDEE